MVKESKLPLLFEVNGLRYYHLKKHSEARKRYSCVVCCFIPQLQLGNMGGEKLQNHNILFIFPRVGLNVVWILKICFIGISSFYFYTNTTISFVGGLCLASTSSSNPILVCFCVSSLPHLHRSRNLPWFAEVRGTGRKVSDQLISHSKLRLSWGWVEVELGSDKTNLFR